jgi:predicted phosphodiesterase
MKIGILGDIHEDAAKLSLTIRELEQRQCDIVVCTGDITGFDDRFYSHQYSRDVKYCISAVKANCTFSIIGNHDLYAIKKIPSYSTVFDFPNNWFSLSVAEQKQLSRECIWNYEYDLPVQLCTEEELYLRTLPDHCIVEDSGMRICFSHSLYPDISGMLAAKRVRQKDFLQHFDFLHGMRCTVGISGHLHPSGILKISEQSIERPRFGVRTVGDSVTQFVCPCIADGTQDNGFTILDTSVQTIESFPLRTPHNSIGW